MHNIKIMFSFLSNYLYYGHKYNAVSIEQPLDFFLASTGHSNSQSAGSYQTPLYYNFT